MLLSPLQGRLTAVGGLWIASLGVLALLGGAEPRTEPNAPIRYDRDIRPLLSDRCFRCHGPDPAERKAYLRLDLDWDVEDADESAVRQREILSPGSVETSELWVRIAHHDVSERMPPESSNKKALSSEELELVRRWIEEGAPYEDHWSFVAPGRPPLPEVQDDDWARGAIDTFVLAELERNGVSPSAPADPELLLRRVFLDLTGLPPTPEELDEFLASPHEDAYEQWVGRLLTEEPYVSRYAERMAVPWLDAARYADTSGIHMDAGRQIWPWRDWVLAAFRDGMPFDQFLTEQLAGDLLEDATVAQRVASGFNRNHVTTDEGGAIAQEYLVEYAVDRTATTGSVFLGLTMGCARCHDHKFDPVSQEEFYSFYAFFDSIDEPGLYSQQRDPNRAFEPAMSVPDPELEAEISGLEDELEVAREELETPVPGEDEKRALFFEEVRAAAEAQWSDAQVVAAQSSGGATLDIQNDGSVLASGENPGVDTHTIELETEGQDLRLLMLEAMPVPWPPVEEEAEPAGGPTEPEESRVGRAPNGNAVLSGIRAEAVSLTDPEQRRPLRFQWAWANIEQANGDFRVVNALDEDTLGWAVDGHGQDGPRVAMFLTEEPFGYEGGTKVLVHLDYQSVYAQHVFARVRLDLGQFGGTGLDSLGLATSGWYATAPFEARDGDRAFQTFYGPEAMRHLDLEQTFGENELKFNFIQKFQDERLNGELAGGVSSTYVARRVFAPSEREVEVSLGTDDGFRLFLDGVEVAQNQTNRGLAADQDRVTLQLDRGEHTIVLKVVNTGGPAGYYWRWVERENELSGNLAAAFLPESARTPVLAEQMRDAWREQFSPEYRAKRERVEALESERATALAAVPMTMVMQELQEPRDTFVLMRGQYDMPDEDRRVERAVPAVFGELPEGAPRNRLGLAAWMTDPDNPLVARVAVNRLWELCFGTGLVATSEDFGMQGEWPSHPELLDWLAIEYRESGWDTKAMVRALVTSSTYRQSSRGRAELDELDPDNRLLARYPRRRLSAEQIRDQVLYVSELLIEAFGGPSVKPYQPEGLWREVAMVQSNTRNFERGDAEELWRRSVYTYWKRASPPPSMLTFDAPTREFCTIRRGETATPLQALVLWNDEQFVEAARVLAERTLLESPMLRVGQDANVDAARLARMFRRCTGRYPDADEAGALAAALADFRERYSDSPEDAAALLETGDAPARTAGAEGAPENAPSASELAAWTMIANALFSLDSMISQG